MPTDGNHLHVPPLQAAAELRWLLSSFLDIVGDVGGRGLLGVVADLLAIRGVDHDGRRGENECTQSHRERVANRQTGSERRACVGEKVSVVTPSLYQCSSTHSSILTHAGQFPEGQADRPAPSSGKHCSSCLGTSLLIFVVLTGSLPRHAIPGCQ
jgi:hypothetical protein